MEDEDEDEWAQYDHAEDEDSQVEEMRCYLFFFVVVVFSQICPALFRATGRWLAESDGRRSFGAEKVNKSIAAMGSHTPLTRRTRVPAPRSGRRTRASVNYREGEEGRA